MTVLVTGAAGFIGMTLSQQLLARGETVIGVDDLNDYYDPALKLARLATLTDKPGFTFQKLDIADTDAVLALNDPALKIDRIVNLAAQAGVRYSLKNPYAYIRSNLLGHLNVMELARSIDGFRHMVYASSSSVYGGNTKVPFSVDDRTDTPVSLYAATKRSDELMSHSYSHLYDIPMTGLRFFTVYGPWGRPDMAAWIFVEKMLRGEKIPVFNNGDMYRDFTYIDDIVEGIVRVIDKPATIDGTWDAENPSPATAAAPYQLHNIGSNNPQPLMRYIEVLEKCLGKVAEKNMLPMQPGDVRDTYADVSTLMEAVGYKPKTSIDDGIREFVQWYKAYNNL